ncbi:MAG: S8 family serine peptidase [Elusimicrobia bacterium]|nr:S8 family serine peptidase [Elusimicrobiota bacterium]
MFAPRLLLLLSLAAFPLGAHAGTETAPVPDLPGVKLQAPVPPGPDLEPSVVVSSETARALEKIGWKADHDGGLSRIAGADKGVIPKDYIAKAALDWRNGALFYSSSPEAVPHEMLAPILKGLSSFTSAARVERAKAGAALAAWGFPPSVDGRRLYNPGGDATYFGLMLHSIFESKPDQVAKLGVERVAQALDLLHHAYGQAFHSQAADIAQIDIDRARVILFAPARGGETPLGAPALKARPDPAAMLKGYKAQLEADAAAALASGDEVRRKDSAEALAVLNNLEKQRLHRSLDLTEVPEPGKEAKPVPVGGEAKPGPLGGGPAKEEPYARLSSGLPGLLRVLDRVNGTPLTPDQQENLIKSFPMGDLVWRMGAQDLWKQGLTGKGVKVAVIDQGIAEHPELEGSVKARVNFTLQRGKGAVGPHGTHVAGTIHALAPDAELRGYTVFDGGFMGGNDALREDNEQGIIDAIHRAVKDGNQVINMSLGSGQGPSNQLARVVEEYASKGVIFLIAAGNSRNDSGGIDSPSSAPSAITVGALDSAGRMSDFSNFGERFDPRKLTTIVKDVFMAPGSNIVSTMPGSTLALGGKREPEYAAMSGTSMATPAMSGVSALLVQDMGQMTLVPSPVEMAQRLKAALVKSSTPMALDKLPPGVPIDQPFFVVRPLQALEALRESAVPVAGK